MTSAGPVLIGIYGAGGAGRGIMPLVRAELQNERCSVVFIDDAHAGEFINGHNVLSWHGYLHEPAAAKSVCLAISDSRIREKLAIECVEANVRIIGARALNVVQMDNVEIGEGACLSPFVTITSNVRIGRYFHANLYSYVEHDCMIGDFVTFGPGAKCNGNVWIDDHAYIGAGAIIRQGRPGKPIKIGAGAVVGMGAVVTKDVAANTVVVGNPARVLVKE